VSEAAPPVAFPSYTEVVPVYEARDDANLAVVRAILEGGDIPAIVYAEHAARLGLRAASRLLLVPTSFAERAREVLRASGVRAPAPPARDDLAALWSSEVVPAIAGAPPHSLAGAIALCGDALRAALFGALEAAGPRGLEVLRDVALALAVSGPLAAAREAAGYLAACEVFRDRRREMVLALGAIAARGADADLALRVASALERFRGAAETERALVPLLEHEDAAVRDAAIEALFSVSGGETLGFEPDAEPAARAAAVRRWSERVGIRLR
jgi:hypothetical protein